MENIIIIAIIAVLLIIGLRSTKKHLKGKGSCCGGGSAAPKQNKKLNNVIAKKTFIVESMTCDHCKSWVEKAVNDIDGAACKVNLSKKEALVSLEKEISDEVIIDAIEKAGYKVRK